MKTNRILILSFGVVYAIGIGAKPVNLTIPWSEITTVAELWHASPNHLHDLFSALHLQQAGLKPVHTLLVNGDTIGAAEKLLEYFQQTDRDWVVGSLELWTDNEALMMANALIADTVIRNGIAVKIPMNPEGGWLWNYTGPDRDDEFGYSLNGHSYLPALYQAKVMTGHKKYVEVFDRLVKDWILHHPLPAEGDSIYMVLDPTKNLDWRDIGEVEWRTLEAGRRLGATWPQTFYAFQQEEAFSSATRLLMLSSISEQATYLRHYHKHGHNWTTMEMNGLALAGLAFPEFRDAHDWTAYSLDVMNNEINRQVYPDGVQTEISTKTQWVALRRFESVAENFNNANHQISESYYNRLEEMYNYLAFAMRPDGHQPLNNDSDREDLRPRVLKAAQKFNRPDWQWIATNGEKGILPKVAPSLTFPWGGMHIMRNGWHHQAHWSFFDAGPYGTGHQHRDKLHLSIAAFGKDILVDGGRYTHKDYFSFDPATWRGYFRSSHSHNVILVDGKGQKMDVTRARNALVEQKDYLHHPLYDYATGTFSAGYENLEGKAIHTRSIIYLQDRYWVVLDQFDTDRPRNLEVLWHYASGYPITVVASEAVSTNSNAPNLRIVPLGELAWETDLIEGQEKPFIQGWYSAEYGTKVANPTLVYSAGISGPVTFAWLLVPAKGLVPNIDARLRKKGKAVMVTVRGKDQEPVVIQLPLDGDVSKVKVKMNQ